MQAFFTERAGSVHLSQLLLSTKPLFLFLYSFKEKVQKDESQTYRLTTKKNRRQAATSK